MYEIHWKQNPINDCPTGYFEEDDDIADCKTCTMLWSACQILLMTDVLKINFCTETHGEIMGRKYINFN